MSIMQDAQFTTVSPQEFNEQIKSRGIIIVDVRQPDEYECGHIKDAINIDVKDENFIDNAVCQLPKDKVIAVYCRSGKRSALAGEMLSEKGYQVVNLDGGIEAWISNNYPVVRK